MGMESFTIKMEECMMEIGVRIRWKVSENYFINLED